MSNEYSPRTDRELLALRDLLIAALTQADALPEPLLLKKALVGRAAGDGERSPAAEEVLKQGGPAADILRDFTSRFRHALEAARAEEEAESQDAPEWEGLLRFEDAPDVSVPLDVGRRDRRERHPIESADATLRRGAEPEIVNEILAGGAVASSFAAAASVAKAKLEATTQRRKNDLDADNERRRIESNERIAGFQGMTAQTEVEGTDPGDA
ncbi:hypothetical protein ACWD2L_05980 [Streptomyces sp. NPDC002754]